MQSSSDDRQDGLSGGAQSFKDDAERFYQSFGIPSSATAAPGYVDYWQPVRRRELKVTVSPHTSIPR